MSEGWNILKLLQWSQNYFAEKNLPSARLDAELLLAHSLSLKRMDLYLQFERLLTPDELAAYKALVKRRAANEPIAYITGKKEFWSREFLVTPAVLIPRPDTEVLVEVVLSSLRKIPPPSAPPLLRGAGGILGFEMGLGSGAIAITLLKEIPQLKMTTIEISAEAAAIATANTEKHSVSERLQILNENFLEIKTTARFDFIVANPPYVSETELASLESNVKDFEPHTALVAPDNGLAFYPALAAFAKNNLNDNGFIAVEIGESQGAAVSEVFKSAGLQNVLVKKDYAGHDRVVIAFV